MRADISFLLSQIFYTIVDFSMLNMKWKNVRISRNFCCAQQRSTLNSAFFTLFSKEQVVEPSAPCLTSFRLLAHTFTK